MRTGAAEWRTRLLLIGASSLAGLLAAEAAARFLLRSAPAERTLGTPISELSPVLGWKTRPNQFPHEVEILFVIGPYPCVYLLSVVPYVK